MTLAPGHPLFALASPVLCSGVGVRVVLERGEHVVEGRGDLGELELVPVGHRRRNGVTVDGVPEDPSGRTLVLYCGHGELTPSAGVAACGKCLLLPRAPAGGR